MSKEEEKSGSGNFVRSALTGSRRQPHTSHKVDWVPLFPGQGPDSQGNPPTRPVNTDPTPSPDSTHPAPERSLSQDSGYGCSLPRDADPPSAVSEWQQPPLPGRGLQKPRRSAPPTPPSKEVRPIPELPGGSSKKRRHHYENHRPSTISEHESDVHSATGSQYENYRLQLDSVKEESSPSSNDSTSSGADHAAGPLLCLQCESTQTQGQSNRASTLPQSGTSSPNYHPTSRHISRSSSMDGLVCDLCNSRLVSESEAAASATPVFSAERHSVPPPVPRRRPPKPPPRQQSL